MDKTEQFFKLHEEYENKLLAINSYYSDVLANALDEDTKEKIYGEYREFYSVIGEYTESLGLENNIDSKLAIAVARDQYLDSKITNYGIEYKKEEDEFHK
jgi:hypothetical protein